VLALVFVVGVMFIRHPPRLVPLLIAIGLFLGLVRFIPADYFSRIGTMTDAIPGFGDPMTEVSIRGRLSENTVGLLMFMDHPFFGVGWNNYSDHYQEYSRLIGIDPRLQDREPHSLFLEVASESGVLGLVTFGVLLLVVFRSIWRAGRVLRTIGLVDYARMAEALGVALGGYLVAGLFLHMAYPRFFYLLAGIALALPNIAAYERANMALRPPVIHILAAETSIQPSVEP
jgi:putative inorganic carbon (hco3(-)) transporter